jgi:hypothetical protein
MPNRDHDHHDRDRDRDHERHPREIEEPPVLDEDDERALDRAWETVRRRIEEERRLERERRPDDRPPPR